MAYFLSPYFYIYMPDYYFPEGGNIFSAKSVLNLQMDAV